MAHTATLNPQDALLPRAPGGNRAGALMAALVHLGLLIALSFSVDWRTKPPDVVSAELWASVPQTAAPKPTPPPVAVQPEPAPVKPQPAKPEPTPTPTPEVKPDIAVERAKQDALKKKAAAEELAEQKRAAADKLAEKKKADAEKKKRETEAATKADDDKLAKQREENLKRIMGQANEAGSSNNARAGAAAQDAAPSASYVGKLAKRIRDDNLVYTGTAPDSATVEITIRSAAGGTLLGREIVKRSGFPDWDEAVLRAIDKAGNLPRDTDGRVPREITIAFRRRD